LLADGDFAAAELIVPPAVSDAEIERVHCARYRERVPGGALHGRGPRALCSLCGDRCAGGALDAREQRAIGFPWSEAMVERSRRSAGATLAAAREALARGWDAEPARGPHHHPHAHR